MASPTRPRNRRRIWHKVLACFSYEKEYDTDAGHAGVVGHVISRLWVCAGVPSGAAPSGMAAYDIILDTTNDDVYRYISGTTYVQMNATS
ncbi:MAG: hypothetical protein ACXABY_07390 [Candidatus Thorarchaeota archaeon]|jgi:hypothetical protein